MSKKAEASLHGVRRAVRVSVVLALTGSLSLLGADASGQADQSDEPPRGKLLFTRWQGKGIRWDSWPEVYVVKTNGSSMRQLTGGPGSLSPSWHPNGKKFVYTRVMDKFNNYELYLRKLHWDRFERPKRLTTTWRTWDFAPAFSPDGRSIAYEPYPPGDDPGSDIYLYFRAEDRYQEIVSGDDDSRNVTPSWAPDGRRIAFLRAPYTEENGYGSSNTLLVTERRGEQWKSRTLPLPFSRVLGVDWSPDGESLVIGGVAGDAEDGLDLYLVPSEGGQPVALVTGPGDQWPGSFSPDGRYVAYSDNSQGDEDIFIVEISSKQIWQVTSGKGDDEDPEWSPASH